MAHVLRIKDQPASERPRERLASKGPAALTDAELIAILLRTGLQGMNAVEVGAHLLRASGATRR
jgi:DNA repair protein RadC